MHRWTDRELAYIRQHIKGRKSAEMTEMFNRRFGLDIKVSQIKGILDRYNIRSGVSSRFQPGNRPWNAGFVGFINGRRPGNCYPIGAERKTEKDGYVEVKIGDPQKWKKKHVIVWEKANGRKVPRGSIVIFADGNKLNFEPDNLLLVTQTELCVMNSRGLNVKHKELTKSGKLIADIIIAAANRKSRADQKRRKLTDKKEK